jgi:PAS domain S-box-containing protein
MFRGAFLHKYDKLRARAEESLARGEVRMEIPQSGDIQQLSHELAVQQVELEMQHDELLRANHELGELRNQAELAREHYRKIFGLASAGLLVLSSRGIIAECNQSFARMAGQARESLAGRTLAEFVAQEDRMNFDVLFKQEINHPAGRKIAFRVTDKKERLTSVMLSVVSLGDDDAIPEAYLATLAEMEA